MMSSFSMWCLWLIEISFVVFHNCNEVVFIMWLSDLKWTYFWTINKINVLKVLMFYYFLKPEWKKHNAQSITVSWLELYACMNIKCVGFFYHNITPFPCNIYLININKIQSVKGCPLEFGLAFYLQPEAHDFYCVWNATWPFQDGGRGDTVT